MAGTTSISPSVIKTASPLSMPPTAPAGPGRGHKIRNAANFAYSREALQKPHSHRLLKFEHEIVDRHSRPIAGEVVRIVGIAPEISLAGETKSDRLELLAQCGLLNTMQRLRNRNSLSGPGGMISD